MIHERLLACDSFDHYRVIVNHVRIHTFSVVAHQGTISTLGNDYLGIWHVDNLRLLTVLFLSFPIIFTASLAMSLAPFCIARICLTSLLLGLAQIRH